MNAQLLLLIGSITLMVIGISIVVFAIATYRRSRNHGSPDTHQDSTPASPPVKVIVAHYTNISD